MIHAYADIPIFCNKCKSETNHTCRGEHHRDFPQSTGEGTDYVERLGFRLMTCDGCDNATLEQYFIYDVTDLEANWTAELVYFPFREEWQVEGKHFTQLPPVLDHIYGETVSAFNNNLTVLCALGIRSLLEGICSDKNIPGSNLGESVSNMVCILPKNIVMNLHSMRFLGNEAAHELTAPSIADLRMAIEICEDLLDYLYELDYKAEQLARSHRNRGKLNVKSGP